jgi:MATE family multidrug resistance protein
LVARHLHRPFAVSRWQLLEREKLRALLIVNTNIAIRTLCLSAAFFYFAAVGTRLGESVLAANAVLLHFQTFLAYGLDGFAHAAETLAGNAYGAGRAGRSAPPYAHPRASQCWLRSPTRCFMR